MPTLRFPYYWSTAPADQPPAAAFPNPHRLWWPVVDSFVALPSAPNTAPVRLLLDSGASYCVFSDDIAKLIGLLDIRKGGAYKRLPALGGYMDTWFHWVTVRLIDKRNNQITKDVYAAFIDTPFTSDDQGDPFLGLLGQYSFLDQFSVYLVVGARR